MSNDDPDERSGETAPPHARFERPTIDDGTAMKALADDVGLDANSTYAYVMWADRFASTSVVSRRGPRLDGFVTAFHPPDAPMSLFVWQIGVASSARRTGLGSRMLDHLVQRLQVRQVEATVTPDNAASAALFRSLGSRHGVEVIETPAYPGRLLGAGHEPEILFRVGPFGEPERPTLRPIHPGRPHGAGPTRERHHQR